ncbi:MAG: hypothetical protein LBC61_03720 [Candidatus Peribacteria bacterium]|nr:hypothetical protein [Candidatus Peribacteria bacterium]
MLMFFFVIISQRYHSVTIKSALLKNLLSFINFALSFSNSHFHFKFFFEYSTIFSFKSLQ